MIVTRLRGGLGNQMFQYAHGRSEALRRGEKLALDLSWFDGPGAVSPRRTYDLGIFDLKAAFANKFQVLVAKLRGRYIDGFFQDDSYFKSAEDQIRSDFFFRGSLPSESLQLSKDIAGCRSVCINVRRGDFVTGGIFVGADYYERATQAMLARVPQARFFIFSDDLEWCRANLGFIPKAVFVGHEHAGPHFSGYLRLMAMCQHFIIPNSTFGWWAAWLGTAPDKIVIASQKWQQPPGERAEPILKNWLQM